MNVGEYIKSLRLKHGLTQEELGAKVGVKRAAVQKWECGLTQNLKRTTIQKLSDVFGVSPSLFINADISEDNNSSSEKHLDDDTNTVIFNRNGEVIKRKFSEEQMNYLEKFINSIADEDSDL